VAIERATALEQLSSEHGPFDIIGDIHGVLMSSVRCSPSSESDHRSRMASFASRHYQAQHPEAER